MKKHLDENGYDHLIRVQHCAGCGEPIFNYVLNGVLKPHTALTWQHWLMVRHGPRKPVGLEARTVMTQIPAHASLSYCQDCFPGWTRQNTGECAVCGEQVPQDLGHSRCEAFDRHVLGIGGRYTNNRVYLLHTKCLPNHFHRIHEKVQN